MTRSSRSRRRSLPYWPIEPKAARPILCVRRHSGRTVQAHDLRTSLRGICDGLLTGEEWRARYNGRSWSPEPIRASGG